MLVRIIQADIVGNNRKVLETFDNFIDALNYGVKINNGRQPMKVDKFTFFWDYENGMIFTELEVFYQFRVGSIVQSDNNNSPIRFTDAKVIYAYADNYLPMYAVRLQDGSERIVREKDIRIQRLF